MTRKDAPRLWSFSSPLGIVRRIKVRGPRITPAIDQSNESTRWSSVAKPRNTEGSMGKGDHRDRKETKKPKKNAAKGATKDTKKK